MNYPNAITKKKNINIDYANRGMTLESDINNSNEYYLNEKIALIYKKPTPIKITKVSYPTRRQTKIKEAFFETPSTTDYNGLYKGRYIDFEAKETKNKTSFPINNIHPHQIEHLKQVLNHKGIGFIIIRFTLLNKTLLYKGEDFINFLEHNKRKSIPLKEIEEKGYLIDLKYCPRLDYLKIIDQIYLGGK